jgi:hypothetical protein
MIVLSTACGPPLTDPSSENITGRWGTADKFGPLSDMNLEITQGADGKVVGKWTAVVPGPRPVCPPELDANATGPVSGTNTVFEIRLAMLGAGDFQGQVVDENTLRGSFDSCANTYLSTFTRLPAG